MLGETCIGGRYIRKSFPSCISVPVPFISAVDQLNGRFWHQGNHPIPDVLRRRMFEIDWRVIESISKFIQVGIDELKQTEAKQKRVGDKRSCLGSISSRRSRCLCVTSPVTMEPPLISGPNKVMSAVVHPLPPLPSSNNIDVEACEPPLSVWRRRRR